MSIASGKISTEMLQCNKTNRAQNGVVREFCRMSEQSNGMRAAEAKRTELVALGSHCRPAGNLSWTNHRARMRENAKPVLSLVGSTVG